MKSLLATFVLCLIFLGGLQAQYPTPPPAAAGVGGSCGMYLSACCPGGSCNRGFVCTSDLSSTPICYTPRCTDTQQCMQYAYWTECIVSLMNCNACGFIDQKCCSEQTGAIQRNAPCYQGFPVNGYCRGAYPAPPAATSYPIPAPSTTSQPIPTYAAKPPAASSYPNYSPSSIPSPYNSPKTPSPAPPKTPETKPASGPKPNSSLAPPSPPSANSTTTYSPPVNYSPTLFSSAPPKTPEQYAKAGPEFRDQSGKICCSYVCDGITTFENGSCCGTATQSDDNDDELYTCDYGQPSDFNCAEQC